MTIRLNCVEETGHARSGSWTFHLRDDTRVTPPGANELVVEGSKIDLLFSSTSGVPVGYARADLILDDNPQQPAVACMDRCEFQRRDGRDFAQIFALLIAEMIFPREWESPAPLWCAWHRS